MISQRCPKPCTIVNCGQIATEDDIAKQKEKLEAEKEALERKKGSFVCGSQVDRPDSFFLVHMAVESLEAVAEEGRNVGERVAESLREVMGAVETTVEATDDKPKKKRRKAKAFDEDEIF